MAKQVVFIVTTGEDGKGEGQGFCKMAGPLDGQVVSIQYINDRMATFESTASFVFTGADSGKPVLEVENVDGRQTWNIENGPTLENEPIKVVVSNGGANRAGSFVVTCK
jgi:hypothetical protein